MVDLEPSPPKSMPPTRAGVVAGELRKLILSGTLPAGARLKQSEVAERFGVSTTPVREAFGVLARQGLVRQDAHRGVVVFVPSIADVSENWELRIALEGLAVELAAEEITEAELAQLDLMMKEMRTALEEEPQFFVSVLNPRFHALICSAARRPVLTEITTGLRDSSIAYQSLIATRDLPDPYVELIQAQHEEIVAALRARAPKRAAKVLTAHLEASRQEILGLIEAQEGSA